MEKRLDLVFGSDSDEKKILPGILRFSNDFPDYTVNVHYASADNTPHKVTTTVAEILTYQSSSSGRVLISGAGMSNVLTGVMKTHATLSDLVIGVPITDSVTEGVSSLLSTSEKPPLNSVLTVGLNNTYAALNIAQRFINQKFNDIAVFDSHQMYQEQYDKLFKEFNALKLLHRVKVKQGVSQISPDDVIVGIYDFNCPLIEEVDARLKPGNGVQVFCALEKPFDIVRYSHCLDRLDATGLVSATGYRNAVQIAAQLLQYQPSLDVIADMKKTKKTELENNKGLIIKSGVVAKL
jgi:phosphoribosylcarboxyaminoimidazole (NCAIR) mutase